ncbi:addiction module toxin RelE [Candidatus Fermentibacteria bacterium]|nr:MAG: addiction module toxin RelE [Candidatus Fermentibacteria bacterium]
MTYSIKFKKSVSKDLKKIDKPEADRILKKLAAELPGKADSLPELKGKYAGLRKYRIGNYRIVFSIVKSTILITRIRHRKEAYRN